MAEAAMRVDRVERVTNLLLVLLDAQVPLTLEHIVHTVEGYPPNHDAYRQAFERDKRLLREQGVVVVVEPVPGTDVSGYRIRPEDYYLPDLALTPEEQEALNLALAGVALDESAGQGIAWKLGVAESLHSAQAPLTASLPSAPQLPLLHEAMRQRVAVGFTHRGLARVVDPYGLLFRHGHWYLVGRDHHRDALRSFRVDRMDGLPVLVEGSHFDRPEGFDPASALAEEAWLIGEGDGVTARVAVDAIHAGMVEAELGSRAVVERRSDGWIEVELQVVNRDAFRAWVLGLLDHAEVLAPDDLRAELVSWLEAVVAAGPH